MRRQCLVPTLALALALSGCAMPPVPPGFREAACAAREHLAGAEAESLAAAEGVSSGDIDRLAIAAAGMERQAAAASTALGRAEAWEPADQLVAELESAAIDYGRAATQFGAGARQGIGPEVDLAVASAQDAAAALARADRELERLTTAVRLQPC